MSFLGKGSDVGSDLYNPAKYGSSGAPVERVSFEEIPRQSCSNPACSSGWTKPWRSRRRPIFEGQWGCSRRCVMAMVRAAVRRETGDGRAVQDAEPHRHRVPLGLVMLAQGWITNPQLQAALKSQRASGTGRIGDWLVSECGLEAEQVTRGLSVQWSCPVLSLDGFVPQEMALVMPRNFVEEFGLVPLRVAASRLLYLACEDRLNASVAYAVEQMSGLKVASGLVEAGKLKQARASLLAADGVPVSVHTASDDPGLVELITAELEEWQPLAARLVRLHQKYWLRLWLESGTKGSAGSLPRSAGDMHDCIYTLGARA